MLCRRGPLRKERAKRVYKDKDKDKDKKTERDKDDDEIFQGKIKGKIENPAGLGTLKGTFEGRFKGRVEASIKGIYFIPPSACSEAGRPLSDEEEAALKKRRRDVDSTYDPKNLRYHVNTPGRYRSPTEVEEKRKRAAGVEKEKLKQREEEEKKLSPFLRKEHPDLLKERKSWMNR